MELYPKFIIETDDELGDCLIISKVVYHKHIATDITKVKGGGWFRYDSKTNTFTFHGESYDFGKATLENIKKCVEDGKVFTNKTLSRCIANKYNFAYDTGSEIILLKEK